MSEAMGVADTGNGNSDGQTFRLWEQLLTSSPTMMTKSVGSLLLSILGFGILAWLKSLSGMYFPSIILLTVLAITIWAGWESGTIVGIVMGLSADFLYIPPIGSVLYDLGAQAHFLLVLTFTLSVAILIGSLRSAVGQTVAAKLEAERARSLMERTLAVVTHDIRNPLGVIRMSAELMSEPDTVSRESSFDGPRKIVESIDRIDGMIQDLLDFSAVETGLVKLRFSQCDLALEINRLVADLNLIYANRIRLLAPCACFGQWAVDAIRRTVENLVTNAVKYGEPGGPITIEIERRSGELEVSVQNRGPAIPADRQRDIFEFFQRLGNDIGRQRGWGIGLALVKQVALAHGGDIRLTSDADSGTRFSIIIPAAV